LEFHSWRSSDKKVLAAWRLYSSHLNTRETADKAWSDKKFDLLVKLVHLIGQSLGYKNIDEATIRDNTYIPQGYVDVESELHQIRKSWLEVLSGQRPVPMTMVGPVHLKEPMGLVQEIASPEEAHPALPSAPVDRN